MYLSKKSISILLFIVCIACSSLVIAETKYVSDELVINMRSGKGNGFKIIKIIKSGTPVTILKTDSGYAKVKTPQGVEGWVLTRFLMKTPSARTLLAKAQDDVTKIKNQFETIDDDLVRLRNERDILADSEKKLLTEQKKLKTELSKLKKIAARPMQLEAENEQLRNELLKIENESHILKQKVQTLQNNSDKEWVIVGGSVLFFGMFLGFIIPKLRTGQRKANWNRL